jgi:HSP20 family protein
MVNLRLRQPETPARRATYDWPNLSDIDRDIFAPFFAMMRPAEGMSELAWAPRVDIIEKPEAWLFKAELPDCRPEDINVTVEEGTLVIKGERKFEEEVKEGNYTRLERQYGTFERRFSLPAGVDLNSVKADYKNGVLSLTVQKKEDVKPKSVKIDVS